MPRWTRIRRRSPFGYDAADRQTSDTWYAAGGSLLQTQTFGYDANGNLTSATDPYGSYALTYDRLDRPQTVAEPFGLSLTFGYDANGNRTAVTDNRGGSQASTYDGLDRLTSRTQAVGGVNSMKAEWTYDPRTGDLAEPDRSGWSGGAWQPAGMTTYTHDDLGRLTGQRQTTAAAPVLFDASYAYAYDLADRLTAKTDNAGGTTYTYDKTGQLTAERSVGYNYDATRNRTTAGYATDPGNRLRSDGTYSYTYDAAGEVTGKTGAGVSWAYAYDLNGQMTSATETDAATGASLGSVSYAYDAFGNRVARTEVDGSGATVSAEEYAVDGWDPAKADAAGTANFDAYADLSSSNVVTMRRLFGDGVDDPVARMAAGGATAWYGTDAVGSVRATFDDAGSVIASADYDAFGNKVSGTLSDRYGFAGGEWDSTLGTYDSRARTYVPSVGRFLQEDPTGFAAGDPNLSRYVGNGPTNATDPSGWWPFDLSDPRAIAALQYGQGLLDQGRAAGQALWNVTTDVTFGSPYNTVRQAVGGPVNHLLPRWENGGFQSVDLVQGLRATQWEFDARSKELEKLDRTVRPYLQYGSDGGRLLTPVPGIGALATTVAGVSDALTAGLVVTKLINAAGGQAADSAASALERMQRGQLPSSLSPSGPTADVKLAAYALNTLLSTPWANGSLADLWTFMEVGKMYADLPGNDPTGNLRLALLRAQQWLVDLKKFPSELDPDSAWRGQQSGEGFEFLATLLATLGLGEWAAGAPKGGSAVRGPCEPGVVDFNRLNPSKPIPYARPAPVPVAKPVTEPPPAKPPITEPPSKQPWPVSPDFVGPIAPATPNPATPAVPGTPIPPKVNNVLGTVRSTNAPPPGYVGGRQFMNDGRGGGQGRRTITAAS